MTTLNLARRIGRLEARTAAASDHYSHEHLVQFVDTDKRVVSTLLLKTGEAGVWTHFPEAHSGPETI